MISACPRGSVEHRLVASRPLRSRAEWHEEDLLLTHFRMAETIRALRQDLLVGPDEEEREWMMARSMWLWRQPIDADEDEGDAFRIERRGLVGFEVIGGETAHSKNVARTALHNSWGRVPVAQSDYPRRIIGATQLPNRKGTAMNRREFLKLSGMLALGATGVQVLGVGMAKAASPKNDPLQVEIAGRTYRGTADGKILVSSDVGKNWAVHTDFSNHYGVSSLSVSNAGTLATVLGYKGWPISLDCDVDQKSWWTADAGSRRRGKA